MSNCYASIAVKGSGVEKLRDFISQEIGNQFFDSLSRAPLDIFIEVEDYGREIEYATKFVRDNDLEAERHALCETELEGYNVSIELNFTKNTVGSDLVNCLADLLARRISRQHDVETAVFFSGAAAPFCFYKDGEAQAVYSSENELLLSQMTWLPKL